MLYITHICIIIFNNNLKNKNKTNTKICIKHSMIVKEKRESTYKIINKQNVYKSLYENNGEKPKLKNKKKS